MCVFGVRTHIEDIDAELCYLRFNMVIRVVIVPGNGSGDVTASNWYEDVRAHLDELPDVEAVLKNMPDPLYARQDRWLPFMEKQLKCGKDTIIIGHSSGAAAAMRYTETHEVLGIILVSAYTSDLGDELEKTSGYFDRPWNWDAMKRNTKFQAQFASKDDPFLPWAEQQEVSRALQPDMHSYTDRGHFQSFQFSDLVRVVTDYIDKYKASE